MPRGKRRKIYSGRALDLRREKARERYKWERGERPQIKGLLTPKISERGNVSYPRMAREVNRDMEKITRLGKPGQKRGAQADITIYTAHGSGDAKEVRKSGVSTGVVFGGDYIPYLRERVYKDFASQLSEREEVTVGSATYVQRRKFNKDREPDAWTVEGENDFFKWGKYDFLRVKIIRIEYIVYVVRRISETRLKKMRKAKKK